MSDQVNGDERLANILNKAIQEASLAYRKAGPSDAEVKDRISYVIGALESALEMIRPDDMEETTHENKRFSIKGLFQ